MAYLNLSTFIPAPVEEVYEYVTAFGNDGPLDDAFQIEYGELLGRNGNVFVTQEEDTKGGDEGPKKTTWRCTFEYPGRRMMETLDSSWSDRVDLFRPVRGGTRWRIRWNTRIGGIRGVAQYLVFRLVGHKRLRHGILDPVRGHFDARRGGHSGTVQVRGQDG